VDVESQLKKGSTFRIYIPAGSQQPKPEVATTTPEPVRGGTETILVVEDEEAVREFVVQLLKSSGYQTISAESGAHALEQWAQRRGKIDLLLTDLMMPGNLTGRELGDRLQAEDPSLKILYSSGYSPGMAGKDIAVLKLNNFLPKPYNPSKLLRSLRHCLDGQTN
jgi:CheY-like chemotaxis protein